MLPCVLFSIPGRNHPLQPRMERAHQPVQPIPHPRDRIDKFSRRGLLRGEWQLRRPPKSDSRAPIALPMYKVVAELRPKLLQRTLEILVDFGSGLARIRHEGF